jgi:phage-related protein
MEHKDAKPVIWLGDSRKQVQAFPQAVRHDIGSALYDVLHAFQKKSPKGRKTARKDIEMIERRHKEAMNIAKEKLS